VIKVKRETKRGSIKKHHGGEANARVGIVIDVPAEETEGEGRETKGIKAPE